MIIELAIVAVAAVVYSVHKHITVSQIKADVQAVVAKVEADAKVAETKALTVVATLKADLAKWL